MNENTTAANGQAPDRINVEESDAVQRWARKFDATPDQIREAVQAVGDLAADVEMHLKGSHATTNADQEARAEAASKPT